MGTVVSSIISAIVSGVVVGYVNHRSTREYNKKSQIRAIKKETLINLFSKRYELVPLTKQLSKSINSFKQIMSLAEINLNEQAANYANDILNSQLVTLRNNAGLQEALGAVPAVFYDNENVMFHYLKLVNGDSPKDPEDDHLYNLLKEMCNDPDIGIDTSNWDRDIIMKPLHV